jgi:hypothetical protein
MHIPNDAANPFRPVAVKPAVGPIYCRRMANDIVDRIELYGDLDLRPLVSTPMQPIPTIPSGFQHVEPGIPTTGDPSADLNPPPRVVYGF